MILMPGGLCFEEEGKQPHFQHPSTLLKEIRIWDSIRFDLDLKLKFGFQLVGLDWERSEFKFGEIYTSTRL